MVAVFAIVRTTTEGWASLQTIGIAGPRGAAAGAFLAIESRIATQPLVPLRIFESRLLAGANVLVLLMSAAMFAMWYFVSLYLQQVLGYSPIKAGLAFLPMTLTIAAGRCAPPPSSGASASADAAHGFVFSSVGLLLFSRVHAGGDYAERCAAPSLLCPSAWASAWCR